MDEDFFKILWHEYCAVDGFCLKAHQRLNFLAAWFFTGRCPWMDEEEGWAYTSVSE